MRDNLRTELEQKTAEIARLEAALRTTRADFDALAYTVSHDLKSPLTTILGYGELLATLDDPAPDVRVELIDNMLSGAHRLNAMIDALLAYSRIGSGPLDRQQVQSAELIRTTWRAVSTELGVRATALQLTEPLPELAGDPALLARLFHILLDNAVRYRRTDVELSIRISATVRAATVQFTIADNGTGMDPRFQGQLFRLFQRFPNANGTDGQGVGLAFAQRIVQRHGGEVWLESEVGEGTTVGVILPC